MMSLDDAVLALIIAQLPLFDRVSLRGTCARMRPLIPAPHKRTPQKQWRWAIRRDEPKIACEAALAGARDLQRYAGDTATLGECRDVWTTQFASFARAAHRDIETTREYDNKQFAMTRAIFNLDHEAILALASTRTIFSKRVLIRIGKYFPDTVVREFLDKFGSTRTFKLASTIRAIIKGALKKQRTSLAQMCIDIESYSTEKNARAFKEGIILQGNVVQLREYQCFRICGHDMYVAALSGNREMCEHIRANIAGPFSFGYMIKGAVEGEHVHIINLALEWADKCATDDEISFAIPDDYISHPEVFRADCILRTLTQMLRLCIARGSSTQMFCALYDHCARRVTLAQNIDYARAAHLLRQGPVIAKQCIERIKAHEESRDRIPIIANYDAIFKSVSSGGAYWLVDAIYKQAEKEGRTREINIENVLIDAACGLAALILRGHFARKVQEHLAA